ncbi:hypothetical protein GMDG_05245 [Pseudogymnoascus destructans 20631-21]|uniref:Chromo domain-containing protein n=1 Tax=Pseudogymnoascus destructans (strain ATCC MYA-4855 / 20631-21) TaxID=658429 RepID=L8FMD5_PSED2|nr:hypothetical protein GMDG_05245 [Pseudogymnoascus destructans 20631-21]
MTEATKVSPFFANYGYQPETYRQPRPDKSRAEQTMIAVEQLKSFHEQLATDIQFLNERSAVYANKKRSMEPAFKEGDKLPKKSRLHPVFHVSLLEPARGNTPIATDTELQPENEIVEYEVEAILDRRLVGRKEEFLIKWKGYEPTDNSWETVRNLRCPELLEVFRRRHPTIKEARRQGHEKVLARGSTLGNGSRRAVQESPFDLCLPTLLLLCFIQFVQRFQTTTQHLNTTGFESLLLFVKTHATGICFLSAEVCLSLLRCRRFLFYLKTLFFFSKLLPISWRRGASVAFGIAMSTFTTTMTTSNNNTESIVVKTAATWRH